MNFTNDVAQVAHNGKESLKNFDDDVNERFGTVTARQVVAQRMVLQPIEKNA